MTELVPCSFPWLPQFPHTPNTTIAPPTALIRTARRLACANTIPPLAAPGPADPPPPDVGEAGAVGEIGLVGLAGLEGPDGTLIPVDVADEELFPEVSVADPVGTLVGLLKFGSEVRGEKGVPAEGTGTGVAPFTTKELRGKPAALHSSSKAKRDFRQ